MTKPIYSVVDLETTGHAAKKGDRIIQIAIVQVQDGRIIHEYNQFVNPERSIPPFIATLTNIQDELVEQYEPFSHYAAHVHRLLEGTIFVAHNASFDLNFLQEEFERCQLPPWTGRIIDTVEFSKIMYPRASSYRLSELAAELGISLRQAHRADDDALATAQLLLRLFQKLDALPVETIRHVHKRSFVLKSDISYVLYERLRARQDHWSGPQYRTIPLAPFEDERYVTESPTFPTHKEEWFRYVQRMNETYEWREVQLEYMEQIGRAFQEQREIAIEIPNGIGKTLGYLIPSILYAMERQRPLLISTYTNELVDSIVEKEAAKLNALFNAPIRVTVMKGREQYVSLSKFEQLLTVTDHSYDETLTILQLIVWLSETTTGDLSEVNVSGGGQLLLDRIRKKKRALTEEEAPLDFHTRMVRRAEQSHLIVTNHALLLSNHSYTFIEKACGLVIDEAHQMVNVAMRNVETVFHYTSWKYVIGQLMGEGEYDVLPRITKLVGRYAEQREAMKRQMMYEYERLVDDVDTVISRWITPSSSGERKHLLPIDSVRMKDPLVAQVSRRMYQLLQLLRQYVAPLSNFYLKEEERAYVNEWNDWTTQFEEKMNDWIELFTVVPYATAQTFMEYDVRSVPGSVVFMKKPTSSAPLLRTFVRSLSKESLGIVWTSGTLVVPSYASFIPKQLGLPESVPIHVLRAPASFYERSAVWIVHDFPTVDEVEEEEYIELVADAIVQTTYATNGNMFVLFTSQHMLQKTFHLIQESELLNEYAIFAQGVTSGSNAKLLKLFHQTDRSILFGTNQFWEGIDVKGEAVRAVIVVRLPFSSPKDPLYKLRSEQYTEDGEHPFYDYGLPEAVVRFRQGFSRLMRNAHQRASFIILDQRIETKQYGHYFLDSLPQIEVKKLSIGHIVDTLEDWYNE